MAWSVWFVRAPGVGGGVQELDRLERTLLADSAIDTEFSGSTAVFAAVRDRKLHVCNVGDSRIIVGRDVGGGKLRAFDVSNDHKPDLEGEKARIEAAGGRVFAVEVGGVPGGWAGLGWLPQPRLVKPVPYHHRRHHHRNQTLRRTTSRRLHASACLFECILCCGPCAMLCSRSAFGTIRSTRTA
jgi:hypothetical protein